MTFERRVGGLKKPFKMWMDADIKYGVGRDWSHTCGRPQCFFFNLFGKIHQLRLLVESVISLASVP